ncbi:MAG TPA: AMP-binding protein, partial [Polyangiaceae bacterium]|nr:AMP-binding protein [Polyangiaceae bacterium]
MALPSDLLLDLGRTLAGLLGPDERRRQVRAELRLLPKLLGRTLPKILRGKFARHATLAHYVAEHARKRPASAAILSAEQTLSFAELDARVNGVACTLGQFGLGPAAAIALMALPSPAYLALILGAARAGVGVSLISPALQGELLRRALEAVSPALVVVEPEFESELAALGIRCASYAGQSEFARRIEGNQGRSFEPARVPVSADYVYIFTSGTTGFPKACRVTHERALLAASVFSELIFEFEPGDRLYAPLPLHHSSALLLGAGSCIMAGVPIILRRRFSASEFWGDVARF